MKLASSSLPGVPAAWLRAGCTAWRAWALLEAGEAEAADAILEFVPEKAATALLDEFFPDSV